MPSYCSGCVPESVESAAQDFDGVTDAKIVLDGYVAQQPRERKRRRRVAQDTCKLAAGRIVSDVVFASRMLGYP